MTGDRRVSKRRKGMKKRNCTIIRNLEKSDIRKERGGGRWKK